MKEENNLSLKPHKSSSFGVWLSLILIYFYVFALYCIVCSIVSDESIEWKVFLMVFGGYLLNITIGVIIYRIFSRQKIVVTKDEIIKYKGKKIKFRIKITNLQKLVILQEPLYSKCLCVMIGLFFNCLCTDLVSFRFYKADIFEKRTLDDPLGKMKTFSDDEEVGDLKEYIESLTYRQAKKISQFINIPLVQVKAKLK